MYLFVGIYCFLCLCVYLTESYWPYSGAIPVLLLDKHMHTTPLFSLSLFDLYKSFSAWGLKHTPVQWPSMTAKAGPGALKRQSFWIVSSFPCKLNNFHNYWHSSPKKNENSLIIYSSSCHSKPVWLLWNIKTFWETSVFFSHTMKVSNHQNCLFFKISKFVFCQRKKAIQVWKDVNFSFWVNWHFKSTRRILSPLITDKVESISHRLYKHEPVIMALKTI